MCAAGRAGFRQWLLDFPDEERLKRVRSYAAFVEAQSEFAAAVQAREPSAALAAGRPGVPAAERVVSSIRRFLKS